MPSAQAVGGGAGDSAKSTPTKVPISRTQSAMPSISTTTKSSMPAPSVSSKSEDLAANRREMITNFGVSTSKPTSSPSRESKEKAEEVARKVVSEATRRLPLQLTLTLKLDSTCTAVLQCQQGCRQILKLGGAIRKEGRKEGPSHAEQFLNWL